MSPPRRSPPSFTAALRRLAAILLMGLGLLAGLAGRAEARMPAAVIEAPTLFLGLARTLPGLVDALASGPCRAVGWAAFGRLENGVLARSTPGLFVRSPDSWGTPETVAGLRRVATEVESLFPGRGDLVVTDISRREGGHLRPHKTHQNGRDVDVLLYRDGPGEGARGARDLDVERTWALVMLLRSAGDVDTILMDRGVQARVLNYARGVLHRPQAELDEIFQIVHGGTRKGADALCKHAPGHRTHLHLRFKSPRAEADAVAYDRARGVERLMYVALRGDTLQTVASRFSTTPQDITLENRLGPRTRLSRGERLFVLRPLPQGVVRQGGHPPTDAQGG